jgi:hypothetical protein
MRICSIATKSEVEEFAFYRRVNLKERNTVKCNTKTENQKLLLIFQKSQARESENKCVCVCVCVRE